MEDIDRLAINTIRTLGWDRYVGPPGEKIGMTTFGSSAPLKDVIGEFGFTRERSSRRRARCSPAPPDTIGWTSDERRRTESR